MRKNRNLVEATVPVAADTYAHLLKGGDSADLYREVVSAMNATAAERKRRVFGAPTQTDAVEADGLVWLSFEACTEPA